MGGDWTLRRLGDLTDNHDLRRAPVKQKDRKPGPFPYYGASGIVDYVDSFIFDGEFLLVAEDGENLRTRQTPVAFMATGRFWVNNHAHVITGNNRAVTRYIHYALQYVDIAPYLTGAVMPKLTQLNLNFIEIPTPPLSVQEAISDLLGALDDKIELNRRIAKTLEIAARALYRSWFVDFDPICSKGASRLLQLSDDVAIHFPVQLDDDGVPQNWSSTNDKLAIVERDSVQPDQVLPETPYIGLEHIDSRNLFLTRHGCASDVSSLKTRFARGDLLFGKLRPYFHKVALAPFDGICSSDILVFRPKHGVPLSFLALAFSEKSFIDMASNASGGTRMPRADWGYMQAQTAVRPSDELLCIFDEAVGPLLERAQAAQEQCRTLINMRDTLLPKLLLGELRIRDAERAAAIA